MATNQDIYEIVIKNNQALASLSQTQKKVQETASTFDNLKNAIAGIAIGAFLRDVIAFGDEIGKLSEATGIAIESVLGFQKAVKGLGGEYEGAGKSLLKFVDNVGAAASGSANLQDAFARVGVTLKDLGTLSETELLAKTLRGLGGVGDKAEQSNLKLALLGKEFRKVKVDGDEAADSFDKNSAASVKYVASIEAAARAQGNWEQAVGAFKTSILLAIEPITEFLARLDPDRIEKFASAIARVSAVLAVWYGYTKLVAITASLTASFTGLAAAATALGIGLAIVFAKMLLVVAAIGALVAIVDFAFDTDIIEKFSNIIGKAVDKVKDFVGIKPADPVVTSENTKAVEDHTKKQEEAGKAVREVTDAFKNQRLAIQTVSDDFSKVNAKMIDQINLNNSLIGKTKEYQDVTKAQDTIIQRAIEATDKLRDSKEKLTAEEQRAGLGASIDAQIAKIVELAEADQQRVKTVTENTQRIEMNDKLRLFGIQNQIDSQQKLKDIQDDIAKSTMSEIEKKYYDIEKAANASAKAAIEAEAARIGRPLNPEEQKRYYDESLKGTEELKAAQAEAYSQSREFSTGWKQAFNEYIDNATNAALSARNIFAKATQGMEDLLVNFTKTGKFEFNSFVSSMLESLLRSQLQQTMANIFSAMGTSGKTGGGFLGSLLGFANGGMIPTNGPVLVGERGPEIISGAGGRMVTPNDKIGGGGSTNVTYNISAVDASSFKAMIARDPSFIHAVAMQGAKSTPGRR